MEYNRSRLKSWALWVSVAGALWTIASAFGLPEKVGITEGMFTNCLTAIGGVLIAFGIVNNPTDPDHL